jgi:hypothetical protein
LPAFHLRRRRQRGARPWCRFLVKVPFSSVR